ncbi:hypothetical protein RM533_02800 [Croceicoccus sp. F390]|uniref:DUF4342 domain-containing protein n=1 Tax=Croceicoccus esteveae TaxID=3075597 RepID=A0ABU2ZEU0_9SPHN|nr:hypothetical protein [Croceicoccus sp. F390]MDT0575112.1 hypothetical protein [Croceicoccus sp. F390]
MPVTEYEVLQAKTTRNAAHEIFRTQKDLVKADLDAAGIGERIKARVTDEGRHIVHEASDTASEHPQVFKIGAIALGALVLHKPVLGALGAILGIGHSDDD